MANYNRTSALIIILLLLYTILTTLSLSFSLYGGSLPSTVPLITPLLGISFLFVIMGTLLLVILNSFKKTFTRLEEEKWKIKKELKHLSLSHEKIIEKRTLEIAVVNASLNREIAERIQAETAALKLQKQMELILNSAGEGIFGIDTKGDVTFANTSALLMVGWEKDALIGKPHHQLVHHSLADASPYDEKDCPIRQAYKDGIVHSCSDDVFWTKEGTSFPVEYVSTPIVENSHVSGAVVVFRDTSTFA